MKRSLLAIFAAALAAAALPALASAQVVEVGETSTPVVAPTCPAGVSASKCTIVLTRVTALETLNDGHAYPTTIHHAGDIVALTLGISDLSSNAKTRKSDISYLDKTYDGTPRAKVTVLRTSGPRSQYGWEVAATSAPIFLQHYLGGVTQFPLSKPIPVVAGERIALTVPTWAPVLSFDLTSNKFAYRQSRSTNCSHPPGSEQAQQKVGEIAHYKCNYAGTRAEYTVTEITTPTRTS
jgi:hypothetical protein